MVGQIVFIEKKQDIGKIWLSSRPLHARSKIIILIDITPRKSLIPPNCHYSPRFKRKGKNVLTSLDCFDNDTILKRGIEIMNWNPVTILNIKTF